jgi:site-specific recombinase XerD
MITQFENYLHFRDYNSRDYPGYVKRFLTYCINSKIDYLNINNTEIEQYLLILKNLKLQNGSINNHIKALRMFYRFLHGHNHTNINVEDLFRNIKLLKVDRKIKETFTLEELNEMIKDTTTFDCSPLQALKVKTIIYFVFFTGVRLNELLHLKRKDIELDNCLATIRVPTKNKTERIVLFPQEVSILLGNYFKNEPQETINAFNITNGQLKHIIGKMKQYAPKKKPFTVHILRHSFANMLARNMVDMRVAQKLLGHKSIKSTAIYYDPDIETIKEIYRENISLTKKRKRRK